MKASDFIASFLHAQGVTHVFEVVGGMITHMLDSLHRAGHVRIVSMHHEQGAAFAAEGYGRMTGVPGVAMATSGPGATNLLTAIGSCYFDSTPTVFITGQVNRSEQKGDLPIRQLGFQETDVVSMAKPITKWAHLVTTVDELPHTLAEAFRVALSGRPGPVLIDIPMDVQRANIDAPEPARVTPEAAPSPAPGMVAEMLTALAASARPLVLAGGGAASSRIRAPFAELAAALRTPVVSSLMAVDVLAYDDPLRVGLIGSYGNRWANHAIARADFLLVVGSRLDIRQTGSQTDQFKGDRTIWHVDVAPGEMNHRVQGCHAVLAHLEPFIASTLQAAASRPMPAREAWIAEIAKMRAAWPDTSEIASVPGINPNVLMHQLSAASRGCAAYVVDVGQHQMWAAQSLEPTGSQRFVTSGGMGAMGFSLPTAVGAAFAAAGRPVVVIAGDGSLQLNIQELQTVFRNRLPIKIVILNNECHGMVRQFQQSYFEQRYQSTFWGYSAPAFHRVAQAYGIEAEMVSEPDHVEAALARMWADPTAPFLLEVKVDTMANAYPKLAFGRPITEMEPQATPLEMEGT
jgi:acetolactate synthase I/II/III large subunit